jgi:predicted peptidase
VRWPLIFYHHGGGESGDNVEQLKVRGLPMIVEQQPDFPFIVLSPQAPSNLDGELLAELVGPAWGNLLVEILTTYSVDLSRVYMTGNSKGGTITWFLGAVLHEVFAAIAPLAAEAISNPSEVCHLKDTPVWVFHGENDTLIPPEEAKQMVEALEACGGDVRLTVYPNAGHNITGITYAGSELWDWFLSHSLGEVKASVQPYGKLPSAWASIKNVR